MLQNRQTFKEMTSNIIHIVALGGGFKFPRKIHLNTQCPPPPIFRPSYTSAFKIGIDTKEALLMVQTFT